MLVAGTALSERKNRPSVCTRPLSRTANLPSADLMLKPSLLLAVAETLSLAAAAALSAASSRSRWRIRTCWSSSSTRRSSDALSGVVPSCCAMACGTTATLPDARMIPLTQIRTARIRLPP